MKVNSWKNIVVVELSLILSLTALSLVAAAKSSSTTSAAPAAAGDGKGIGDLRQKYRLKYLTPYTSYPVRLKDHYGIKDNTRWFKHSCKCYIDEINLFSKFFTTEKDEYESRSVTHLLILNHEPKTNFVLDHFEPKHVDSKLRDNSNILYDYEYSFETNLDGEIYTVLYLSNFELVRQYGNTTVDNVNQVYADISCRVNLIMPSGLGDEHSAIVNERIENSMHLRLKLDEPEEGGGEETKTGRKRDRNVAFKPVSAQQQQQQQRMRRSADSNSSSKHTVNPIISHYEMEIVEGPVRVFRDNFRQGLNASCFLSLKDYDFTFAFNSDVSQFIFPAYVEPVPGSNTAAPTTFTNHRLALFFTTTLFSYFLTLL